MRTMNIDMKDIKKAPPLITIEGQMSKQTRLIYDVLLTLIETQKEDEKGFYNTDITSISKITKIKNYKVIERILLKELPNIKLRIDLLSKRTKYRGAIQLIGEIKIIEDTIKVNFPPTIKEMQQGKSYTKLNLNILTKMKSKYSLTMYEIIKKYFVSNSSFFTIPNMSFKEFRDLMGLEKNKHERLSDLKRYVLKQITTDINEKTDFNFDYELFKRNSRSYNHIRFTFSKKQAIATTKTKKQEKTKEELKKEIEELKRQLEEKEKNIYNNKSIINKHIDNEDMKYQQSKEYKESF